MTTICPMINKGCRHCSMEKTRRAHTKITRDPRTRLFRPAGTGVTVVNLGEFCNNDGKHYVRDLKACPNDEKPAPYVKPDDDLVQWMRNRS